MSSGLFKSFRDQLHQVIEPEVRQHLFHVYTTMALTCAAATCGTAVHLMGLWKAGFVTLLLQLVSCVALYLTPARSTNRRFRLGLLLLTGASTGHLLGLTVEHVLLFAPASVITALVGATLCFVSLSISAILAHRGSYLLLGGVFSNMVALVILMTIGNLFLQSWFVYKMSLYLALAAMFGFVLVDTQQIVEDFRQGNDDYIIHSLKLFFVVIDIFRLILSIFIARGRDSRRRQRNENQNSD